MRSTVRDSIARSRRRGQPSDDSGSTDNGIQDAGPRRSLSELVLNLTCPSHPGTSGLVKRRLGMTVMNVNGYAESSSRLEDGDLHRPTSAIAKVNCVVPNLANALKRCSTSRSRASRTGSVSTRDGTGSLSADPVPSLVSTVNSVSARSRFSLPPINLMARGAPVLYEHRMSQFIR